MNIVFHDSAPYDANGLLYALNEYGPGRSRLIEMAGASGLNSVNRALVFLFKEDAGIANYTAIAFPSCYRNSDSTGGRFYCSVKANISEEQYADGTDFTEEYVQKVATAAFTHDAPLSQRKEALENFLVRNGYTDKFLPDAPKEFNQSLNPWKE